MRTSTEQQERRDPSWPRRVKRWFSQLKLGGGPAQVQPVGPICAQQSTAMRRRQDSIVVPVELVSLQEAQRAAAESSALERFPATLRVIQSPSRAQPQEILEIKRMLCGQLSWRAALLVHGRSVPRACWSSLTAHQMLLEESHPTLDASALSTKQHQWRVAITSPSVLARYGQPGRRASSSHHLGLQVVEDDKSAPSSHWQYLEALQEAACDAQTSLEALALTGHAGGEWDPTFLTMYKLGEVVCVTPMTVLKGGRTQAALLVEHATAAPDPTPSPGLAAVSTFSPRYRKQEEGASSRGAKQDKRGYSSILESTGSDMAHILGSTNSDLAHTLDSQDSDLAHFMLAASGVIITVCNLQGQVLKQNAASVAYAGNLSAPPPPAPRSLLSSPVVSFTDTPPAPYDASSPPPPAAGNFLAELLRFEPPDTLEELLEEATVGNVWSAVALVPSSFRDFKLPSHHSGGHREAGWRPCAAAQATSGPTTGAVLKSSASCPVSKPSPSQSKSEQRLAPQTSGAGRGASRGPSRLASCVGPDGFHAPMAHPPEITRETLAGSPRSAQQSPSQTPQVEREGSLVGSRRLLHAQSSRVNLMMGRLDATGPLSSPSPPKSPPLSRRASGVAMTQGSPRSESAFTAASRAAMCEGAGWAPEPALAAAISAPPSTLGTKLARAAQAQIQPPGPASASAPASSDGRAGQSWHEIRVTPLQHQGSTLVVVVQVDMTKRLSFETRLAGVSEACVVLLDSMLPSHVVEHLVVTRQLAASVSSSPDHSRTAAAAATATIGSSGSGRRDGGTGRRSFSLQRPFQSPSPPALGGGQVSSAKAGLASLAASHACVTVLFTDIVGFTTMSSVVQPSQVMAFLNDLYSEFDRLADEHSLYKVETFGDCYVCAGGLMQLDDEGKWSLAPEEANEQRRWAKAGYEAAAVLRFAQAILRTVSTMVMPDGAPLTIRVGVHSGPLTSGVVGYRMPKFCLFGDTMNTASRMETTARAGTVHLSHDTFELLELVGQHGQLECTGGVDVKGKGRMTTYVWSQE